MKFNSPPSESGLILSVSPIEHSKSNAHHFRVFQRTGSSLPTSYNACSGTLLLRTHQSCPGHMERPHLGALINSPSWVPGSSQHQLPAMWVNHLGSGNCNLQWADTKWNRDKLPLPSATQIIKPWVNKYYCCLKLPSFGVVYHIAVNKSNSLLFTAIFSVPGM